MARVKKKPKTFLVCGCGKVDQQKDRFTTASTGSLCECTERDRETGMFLKEKKGILKSKSGLKEVVFSSISITQAADTLERVE